MAPPENDLHTSLSGSTVAENSMNSISIGFEKVSCEEVDETLKALELLLGKAKTPECRDALEQFRSFFSNTGNACSGCSDINKIYKNLIESLDKETDLDHTALCQVLGLDKKQAELDDASNLADLTKKKIAGFSREQLLEMCTFSKISYGDKDGKLTKVGYKTKRQLIEEGYQIIQFFEDGRTENQYSPDKDYRLESRNYGYDLICSNSWDRDAGYIFIKGEEVTIAYHGTRDGSDIKTDFDAYLTKLPFLPEDNSVHSGFYSLFKSSWPSVHKILQGLANERGSAIKDLKINITGHSMGGALASVAALCLNKTENAENVHVATFGSPRVFYKDGAKVYSDCLGKKTIRVACTSDNIPCVPFGGGHEYYKHVGQALKLEANVTTLNLLHYHKLDTYHGLIKGIKQESFKSDNIPSWWYYLAYPFGKLSSNIPGEVPEDNDKEFFEKVKGENKDIKFSKIPREYSTELEEKQKASQLTEELKETKAQLAKKEAELDEQTREVIKLNDTIRELKETNTGLKGNTDNLSNQLTEEKKMLKELKAQSEQNETELKKKIEELNNTRQNQTSRIGELTAKIEELKEIKTKLEEKAESAEKALVNAQAQLEERERELGVAKKNILQLKKDQERVQQNLAAATKRFENLVNELQEDLDEQTREAVQLREAKAQFEQENHRLASQIEKFKGNLKQTKVQLAESKQKLTEEISKVIKLKKEYDGVKAQFEEKERELNGQVTHLTNDKTQLEEDLAEKTNELEGIQAQFVKKEEELSITKQKLDSQTSRIGELTAKIEELKEIKTKLEKKAELAEKALVNAKTQFTAELKEKEVQFKENKIKSNGADQKALGLEQKLDNTNQILAEKIKELESTKAEFTKNKQMLDTANDSVLKLKQGKLNQQASIDDLNSKVTKITEEKNRLEERNGILANQARKVEEKFQHTEVQLAESEQNLAGETSKVTQLRNESNKIKTQLKKEKKTTKELNDQIAQLTAQNNQMEGQLNDTRQDLTNKIDEINRLKKIADKSNNNEEPNNKNENFLEVSNDDKKQGIYAAVSFISSGALAVGASLTILHLAICISLAVAALTFLAVGCYCSYKVNTALSNVEVGQVENGVNYPTVQPQNN